MNRQKNPAIYKVVNNVNGHAYIGRDMYFPERKYVHLHTARKGEGYYLHNAIRKYGEDNFTWTLVENCDEDLLSEREKYWIMTLNPEYNLTSGGEGRSAPMLEETKKKISKALNGNTNGRGSPRMKGKKHSEETKEKIRQASIARRASKFWSTKKKNGERKLGGGIHLWTKEQKQEQAKKIGQMPWWTNGIDTVKSNESPGPEWWRGRTMKQKEK